MNMKRYDYSTTNLELAIEEAYHLQQCLFLYPDFILVKDDNGDEAYLKFTPIIPSVFYTKIEEFRNTVLLKYNDMVKMREKLKN